MKKILLCTLLLTGTLFIQQSVWAEDVVVFKSPTCGCCSDWVDHMQKNGFSVEVHNLRNMNPIKVEYGIPRNLQTCHTAKIGGYVIEGHLPAGDIQRLLKERPNITGLTAPGMPIGSPGMEGPRKAPYDVLAFGLTAGYLFFQAIINRR